VEDWAEIRRLHRAERVPIKVIARSMGISRNTVRKALRDDGPPRYERAARGSMVDEVEPRIRELLRVTPTMPATVIAERISWEHSIRILRTRVSDLRPVYLPPDPASRTSYEAGELAQFDFWFPDIELPVWLWPDADGQTAAGDDVRVRLLPLGQRTADPLTWGRGSVRGLVAAAVRAGRRCAQDAGVGR